jgi:hypothetical protein
MRGVLRGLVLADWSQRPSENPLAEKDLVLERLVTCQRPHTPKKRPRSRTLLSAWVIRRAEDCQSCARRADDRSRSNRASPLRKAMVDGGVGAVCSLHPRLRRPRASRRHSATGRRSIRQRFTGVAAEIQIIACGYSAQCTVRGCRARATMLARYTDGQGRPFRQRELCERHAAWLKANRRCIH